MKKKHSPETEAKLDELAEILRDVPHDRLRGVLTKDQAVTIRVTSTEKEEMKQAATRYGLTLTEYVSRLHDFAERLNRENQDRRKINRR